MDERIKKYRIEKLNKRAYKGFNDHMKDAMDGYMKLQRAGTKEKKQSGGSGKGFEKTSSEFADLVPARKASRNSPDGKSKGGKVRKKEMNEMIFANNL